MLRVMQEYNYKNNNVSARSTLCFFFFVRSCKEQKCIFGTNQGHIELEKVIVDRSDFWEVKLQYSQSQSIHSDAFGGGGGRKISPGTMLVE